MTELLGVLAENSYAYEHHVELINLLHKGFLAHVYPPAQNDTSMPPGDAHSFALLTEMKQAREAMDSRFAVGEAIWQDWLSDEITLARSPDERIAVTELCQKAVSDESASVKLWQMYIDWIAGNYAACHSLSGADDQTWSAEDKEMCKELFTRDMLLSVLEQAVAATQWRIDESHQIWNRYAQLWQEQLPDRPTNEQISRLYEMFITRLKTPHSTWEDTMQLYWPIISKFEGSNWEAAVAQVNQMGEQAKIHMGLRADHEVKLQRAFQSGDKQAIHQQFQKYLKDEKYRHKRSGPFDYELRSALYERALLTEPTNTEWWLDYVDFLFTDPKAASQSLLPLIERATRHCPWSGELWARRILRADVEQKPRDEIENTKHRATNAGLLDVGGMEEYVKMLQEWCSYLRRHAFRENSSEDDLDTAEVGITMALEDVQEAGKKLYGPNFQGDPLFRVEQIQIKFYGEARRIQQARDIFQSLATRHGHSFDFWSKYYNWEIWLWGHDRLRDPRRVETSETAPHLATQVVEAALRQRELDWPEKVLELYTSHFQHHESSVRLQGALAEARNFANRLAARRAKEAEEAAATAAQQQEQYMAAQAMEESTGTSGEKRKRVNDDQVTNGDTNKKVKINLEAVQGEPHTEASASASAMIKRDREHNTITVRNLPADITETQIKKFFKDCGNTPSINILKHEDGVSASATVEFETHEDVLAAKTRNGKELTGREIRILSGTQSTLYVTNYPADYDEEAIRSLFKSYGEIVSVRLPSLKFNSRRRFCYVQFLTTEMAKAAEASMDNKKLDGLHTLVAKIADPDAKKQRSGPQSEGREIIVKNCDREVNEDEIRTFFSSYGDIERVNILRLVNNKPTGTLFVVFSSSDQATAAAEGANNKPFRDRILKVEISQPKGRNAAPEERARHEDIIVKKSTADATPEPNGDGARRGSDVSMQSGPRAEDDSYKTAKERKIAIFNVPDTVSDARIRTAMEQYGPITKIQLRREKGGAIIEFANLKDAFKVRSGVDVSSLGPETSTGDVGDFLAKPKKPKAGPENGTGTGSSSRPAFAPPQATRPGLGRGGRRGGLGFKRGAFASSNTSRADNGEATSAPSGAKKGNDDFRKMLEASRMAAPKKEEE